jgi:hypothetical protein
LSAAPEQQQHAEWQWASLLGRSSLGSDTVAVGGEERETTLFSGPIGGREIHAGHGVLTIRAGAGEHPSVEGARIAGVSRDIANHLHIQDLRNAPIPIRLIINNNQIITRDEVGRVRTIAPTRELESQWHRDAQIAMDHVLSRTLAQWGVPFVECDAE